MAAREQGPAWTPALAPQVGQRVMVRGVEGRIVRVRPMGTVDVALAGGRLVRVSGLAFEKK